LYILFKMVERVVVQLIEFEYESYIEDELKVINILIHLNYCILRTSSK